MTGLLIAATGLAAIGLLIWQLVRQATKVGAQGVSEATKTDALDALKEANDVENNLDGADRADIDRVLTGPKADSD
jgi:hypothetical protein